MNFKTRKQDQFKGHKGKILRKKLYGAKKRQHEIIEEEINKLEEKKTEFDSSKCQLFTDFPLSKKTLKGLSFSKFEKPTDIQRESIGLALNGSDILGAAKTGSGKTLAFIVPVLECLYKLKWTQYDGLGAVVIAPTRELAFQTFEVLKKVGKFHDFSAGLVIGGKPLKEEAGRINRTNIVICTPGRLLQHMDETTYFSADSLKILVLDEADRILDMGFAQTMNAIIENLPTERQTLLFSATQTRSVKDLARLSLKDPLYVSVHENSLESTPEQLEQSYIVCELHDKMSMLWSFLKNHLKCKILVFITSCKQVKYIHEAMKRLQPGIPLLALHGGMPQLRRVEVYNQFVVKQRACLFATDIAARGLDFPAVNWVVQLDCPEDANTYIHRAGRTARYEKGGQALLVLLPSEEEGMVKQLNDKKIPVDQIRINQKKLYSIQAKLESNCAADPDLKDTAQRAFITYLRSIFLMGNKTVFDVHAVDTEKYASSLGLAIAPKIRFLKKDQKRKEEKAAKKAAVTVNKLPVPTQIKTSTSSDKSKPEDSSDSSSEGENSGSDSDSSLEERTEYSSGGKVEKVDGDSDESSSESDSEMEETDVSVERTKKKQERNKMLKLKHSQVSENSETNTKLKKQTSTKLKDSEKDESDDDDDSSDESESDDSGSDDESDDESDESDSDSDDGKMAKLKDGGGVGFRFDVEDDDGDLFKVKKNVDIDKILGVEPGDGDDGEETVSKTSKKKEKEQQDKFAQAKKLIRKKIVVNTKVMFDEEGQPEIDPNKVPQVDLDIERADNFGGINIEMARKRMRAEDEIDKQIFRQKIKLKHREQRLKRKDENRAKKRPEQIEKEEEMEARLASDDDDEDRPDPLSFIPDPDEIYGKQEDSDSADSYVAGPSTSKKRKLSSKNKFTQQEVGDSSHDSSDSDDVIGSDSDDVIGDDSDDVIGDDSDSNDVMDTELSLKDDETIALRLLRGK